MKKLINYIPSGLFSIIATAIVFYLLLSPPSDIPSEWFGLFNFKYGDKVAHVLLFFILNLAYLYDYTKLMNPQHTKVNKELALTALASSIGLISECCQLAMGNGREFDVLDIAADVVGAFIAFVVMHWFGAHLLRKYLFNVRRHRRRHHSKKHSSSSHSHHHHHHHNHNDWD